MIWCTRRRPRGGRWLARLALGALVTGGALVPSAGPASALPAPAAAGAAPASALARVAPVLAQVTLKPDSSQGPGGPQLQQLVNWGAGMALIVSVMAIVFHALRWGWGSQQHNLARVQDGKEGVGRAAMVAGVIAAAAALINFAVSLGAAVK